MGSRLVLADLTYHSIFILLWSSPGFELDSGADIGPSEPEQPRETADRHLPEPRGRRLLNAHPGVQHPQDELRA